MSEGTDFNITQNDREIVNRRLKITVQGRTLKNAESRGNEMKARTNRLPMNLQFFAEPAQDNPAEPDQKPQDNPAEPDQKPQDNPAEPDQKPQDDDKGQSVQELMVEIAKLKRAQEKAASEAAEYKKKYNAKLSEKEIADEEKAKREAEKEEKFQELLRENKINKLEKSYLALGYTEDEAAKMAIAEVDEDFDAKLKIQRAVQERQKKEYEAEWKSKLPNINAGTGEDEQKEDPFLKGFNSVGNKFNNNGGK